MLIGLTIFTVMGTWQTDAGWSPSAERHGKVRCLSSSETCTSIDLGLCACRVTAIFLNRGREIAPLAMRANVEHNGVLHEWVLIVAVETAPVPYVSLTADAAQAFELTGDRTIIVGSRIAV